MADSKGSTSKEGLSDWCILEAECSDLENDFEQLFEQDTDSDVSDLLDNGELEQGNSLELFHQQECEQSEEQLQILKRSILVQKLSRSLVRVSSRYRCHLSRNRNEGSLQSRTADSSYL